MRESQVEEHLVRMTKRAGGEIRKVQWVARRGAPDRLCLLPGIGEIWIELKRPGKDAEDHQHREHERMRALGCRVHVLDTVKRIDDFFTALTQELK